MDFNRIGKILLVFFAIASCALCFILGRKSVAPMCVTKVLVDTVTIEKPTPYKVTTTDTITVPVYIKIPADTVFVTRVDSIEVQVPIKVEKREYVDSTYRAIVSGPSIGDMRPQLDKIDVYYRTETKLIETRAPLFQPYISANIGQDLVGVGAGVEIRGGVRVGAKYMRVDNRNAVMGEISLTIKAKKNEIYSK